MKKTSSSLAAFAVVSMLAIAPSVHADSAMSATSLSVTAPFQFANNMQIGAKGNDVLQLQKFLNKNAATMIAQAPHAGSVGKETSAFGPATQAAVEVFQKESGIPQTGVVGDLTRAALNKAMLGVVSVNALPTATGMKVDLSTPGTALLSAQYDGGTEKPTIWFAYGTTATAMTTLSPQITADKTAGTTQVTLSNLTAGPCFAAMFVKNSIGTASTAPISCSK